MLQSVLNKSKIHLSRVVEVLNLCKATFPSLRARSAAQYDFKLRNVHANPFTAALLWFFSLVVRQYRFLCSSMTRTLSSISNERVHILSISQKIFLYLLFENGSGVIFISASSGNNYVFIYQNNSQVTDRSGVCHCIKRRM